MTDSAPRTAARLGLGLAALLLSGAAAAAGSVDHPAIKRKFSLPPAADLSYAISARQGGLQIAGSGLVRWRNDGKSYSVTSETRAMLVGKILEAKSEGVVDAYGLAPLRFTEQRFRKEATATTFDRRAGTITFAQSDASYPLLGGEQDRTSIAWQLVAIARAAPKKFRPGSEWEFFVAGQRDAERWSFKVIGEETIATAAGQLHAVHLLRAPPPDAKSQKLDIWLAPAREWYPVKLRFTDADGEYIEQTLEKITAPTQ
ncbi:MAG: DUF3108 domain-containing protein [Burkholderiaceae bacterium]